MKTLTALAIKFIATFAALYVILGLIYAASFQSVVLLTVLIGIISYIIGDIMLLPRTNNVVATSIDFGLAFLMIWSIEAFGNVDDNYLTLFWASIFGGLGVAFCEYFFHIFMYRRFYPHEQKSKQNMTVMNYAMEASEDITPDPEDRQDK